MISSKTEQPLLSRTELSSVISFDAATPSRADVRKKLAEALNSQESLIAVTTIATDFGSKSARVTAHVYNSKEDMTRFESKAVLNRHLAKEKAEEKGTTETKESAPAKKEGKGTEKKIAEEKEVKAEKPEAAHKKEDKVDKKEAVADKKDAKEKKKAVADSKAEQMQGKK